MAKPEWGTKRTCHSCGARFYDLMHSPIICPKCQATVEPDLPFKVRRGTAAAVEPKKVVAPVVGAEDLDIDIDLEAVALVDDDVLDTDDADDDGLMEDTSDLGEDNDDMAVVTGHREEKIDEV